MATKNLAEEPYEKLANAIVVQAANDYRVVLRKKKGNPRNSEAIRDVNEIERFFRSDWYQALTAVDGEYLMDKIRQEM